MARALVIDDDPVARRAVAGALTLAGFEVDEAATASAGRQLAGRRPDVVLLDVVLPDGSGLELLSGFVADDLPVILVTGQDQVEARVAGLERGADDYVTKPFALAELVARVRSLCRRCAQPVPPRPPVGRSEELAVDRDARAVQVLGRPVTLARKEFDLLVDLIDHAGQVRTADELLADVWGSSASWQDAHTVREHVRRLRAKIESDPAAPRWIHTVRGVGYRFGY